MSARVAPAAGPLDSPVLDKLYLAALAFLRAQQLRDGARPRVEAAGHKQCRVAQLEVTAGLVPWEVP